MRTKFSILILALLSPSCVPVEVPTETRPLVNLQVTEDRDMHALGRFMEELDARQIRATLIVDEYVASEGCDQLRAYDASGHEIMVYGRAETPNGESVELVSLTYEEQKAVISAAKTAIEDCRGEAVMGFRSYHFAHNADTWRILDELGIEYNLSFVAHSSNSPTGHVNDVWPCPVEGYEFWAVPMHSVETSNGTKAFCDRPFSSIDASEWEQLMKDELVRMHARGEPLKVEFHPWFSANDEERWAAFVGFLDDAQDREAEFITVAEMAARISESQ